MKWSKNIVPFFKIDAIPHPWLPIKTAYLHPLSPNTHIQILQSDLRTFPLTTSWENLIKDQSIFFMVIILLILIT